MFLLEMGALRLGIRKKMAVEEQQTYGGNGQAARPPELRSLEDILLARALFMRQAGITFNGARDTYDILGYSRQLTVKDYRDRYARGGVAGRIIDAFPNACWRGEMELIEDEDPEKDTPFEQAWKDLAQRLQIQAKLQRADKLSRLSTYAVLLIGAPGALDTELPRGGPDELLYLTPFLGAGGPGGTNATRTAATDADCTIQTFDVSPQSPRFGLPLTYQLKRTDIASPEIARPIHWTRVIHIAENVLEDEVYGQPALERVWNLLDDLDKVTGGGAEAFWLRANQGLHFNVDKEMELKGPDGKSDLATVLAQLKEQSVAYKHQMDRWIRTKGVDVKTLGSDVANFSNPADAILTQIAGATTMPKRILTGSEMGELASSQDRDNWKDQINGRQTGYAGPYIVRPLVDRLIAYGYLPAPAKDVRAYEVRWPHIETMTEKDKTEGAKAWANVNQTYGDVVYTDAEIRDKWSGMAPLDDDQLALIAEKKQQKIADAQAAMAPAPGAPAAGFPRAAEDAEMLRVLEAAIEANNVEVVHRIVGLQQKYKFGSTQVQLPPDVAERLFALGRAIPDEDIYEPEGGRETDAHVTVKYGLTEPNAELLAQVGVKDGPFTPLLGKFGPITLRLGKTSMFAAQDYDVVVVDVESRDLVALNKAIAAGVPTAPATHGEYRPHATVAYVRSGMGEKYVGQDALNGVEVVVKSLIMTDTEGVKTEVVVAA